MTAPLPSGPGDGDIECSLSSGPGEAGWCFRCNGETHFQLEGASECQGRRVTMAANFQHVLKKYKVPKPRGSTNPYSRFIGEQMKKDKTTAKKDVMRDAAPVWAALSQEARKQYAAAEPCTVSKEEAVQYYLKCLQNSAEALESLGVTAGGLAVVPGEDLPYVAGGRAAQEALKPVAVRLMSSRSANEGPRATPSTSARKAELAAAHKHLREEMNALWKKGGHAGNFPYQRHRAGEVVVEGLGVPHCHHVASMGKAAVLDAITALAAGNVVISLKSVTDQDQE